MKRVSIIFFILLSILFTSNISNATPQYSLTDLGSGYAFSINNNGQVVGYVGNLSAILFDNTGQGSNTNLGTGRAFSINDSGQAVGANLWAGNQAVNYKPNPNGTYTAEAMGNGMAYSVNNNGKMVGSSNGNAVIFTYNESLHQYQITSLVAGKAFANNNSDQIVGQRSSDDRAVVWNPNGSGGYTSTALGLLSGYNSSEARSINNGGKIVGNGFNTYTGIEGEYYVDYRATLFDETGGGQNIYLGSLGGYTDSQALSINDVSQIVGVCFNSNFYSGRATLFDPTGTGSNIDLNTTLVNPLSGWTLTVAMSINDNGWITGFMSHSTLGSHSFLLTPVPEPATILFITLAIPFLLKGKRSSI